MKTATHFALHLLPFILLVSNVWSQATPDDMHVATASTEGITYEERQPIHPFRTIDTSPCTLKADIQALEDKWAAALNTKDLNGLMSIYAQDAVRMPNNAPIVVGKAAIQKNHVKDFASRRPGLTYSFETIDVFGDGNVVTEVGLTTIMDGAGKTVERGKYIAIWEKRNGTYQCIREIFNTNK